MSKLYGITGMVSFVFLAIALVKLIEIAGEHSWLGSW